MRITSASFLHCFLPLIYRADINSIGKTLTEVAIKDFPIKSSVKKGGPLDNSLTTYQLLISTVLK